MEVHMVIFLRITVLNVTETFISVTVLKTKIACNCC